MWMMYRAGWASKPGQERILAIRLSREGFWAILNEAEHATFSPDIYSSREAWQSALKVSEVRLQWDPEHDPFGNKMERRAIQLGLKGKYLKDFSEQWIQGIGDITDFVKQQKNKLDKEGIPSIEVPVERLISPDDPALHKSLMLQIP